MGLGNAVRKVVWPHDYVMLPWDNIIASRFGEIASAFSANYTSNFFCCKKLGSPCLYLNLFVCEWVSVKNDDVLAHCESCRSEKLREHCSWIRFACSIRESSSVPAVAGVSLLANCKALKNAWRGWGGLQSASAYRVWAYINPIKLLLEKALVRCPVRSRSFQRVWKQGSLSTCREHVLHSFPSLVSDLGSLSRVANSVPVTNHSGRPKFLADPSVKKKSCWLSLCHW